MSLKWRILYFLARCYWRIFKPLTLGVKLMLIEDDTIWLVQHSYQPGWFLPGGGVKKSEDFETAVRREAREELGAEIDEMQLFGIYSSTSTSRNDHVVVFVSHKFTIGQTDKEEIRAVQQFALGQLPPDVSRGTRRRIEEFVNGRNQPEVGIW
ncbi:NUDIX domain-containing protein [Candidatus Leptofilum sp.]|uniref:NUDIX domain-containing protein n=1 Tax=Candidatus Leptofilum sp. TaxID=3241576 RepID=UPI003B5B6AA0